MLSKRQILFILLTIQIFCLFEFAQTKADADFQTTNEKVELSEKDITALISGFRTTDAIKTVERFKSKMPPPVTDSALREKIIQNLPPPVKKLQIDDDEIIESFRRVASPILDLYNRSKAYHIIVIRHQTPVIFSDTGVVLVVSSGLIERVTNDDELLGFIAHEVGHEYFAKASIQTRYIIGITEKEDEYKALTGKYWESMSLIELHCDSFSALTLAALGKNPLAFIEEIEKIEKEYPKFVGKFHPSPAIRRRVVEGVIGEKFSLPEKKLSDSLKKLKEELSDSENN